MYWSKFFIPTMKEVPAGTEAVSHQLLLRAGLVQMLTSGVYTYLPFGLKALQNIEKVIREEMNNAGAAELFMPCLHPIDIWKKTGRDQTMKDVMIRFTDGRGREMCLGPTHEEIITDIAKNFIHSYRQLPVTLYQIQTKFRDELRTRFGIVRACEFIMKDAYSFDRDMEGLNKSYSIMLNAYNSIFKRLELDTIVIAADSGAMGGSVSHEFMVTAPIGEDAVAVCDDCDYRAAADAVTGLEGNASSTACPNCKKGNLKRMPAIELGHIFQLGTKYSSALEALFLDDNGQRKPLIMGCYGIGVSRVMAAIIEVHHDDKGIIWPKEIAPFGVEIVPLAGGQADSEAYIITDRLYKELRDGGIETLVDDREESPGRKFNDADLIGIPLRVTLGRKALAEGKVEIKLRRTGETIFEPKDNAAAKIRSLMDSV